MPGCGSGFRAVVEVMEVPKVSSTELQTGPVTNQTNQAAAANWGIFGSRFSVLKHGSRKVDWNWEIHQQDLKKNANFSKQILKSKRAGWKVQHESTCTTYISYQK